MAGAPEGVGLGAHILRARPLSHGLGDRRTTRPEGGRLLFTCRYGKRHRALDAAGGAPRARTGDLHSRAYAVGPLNYATHFARGDGLVSCCGGPGVKHPYRFSDGYRDHLGQFNTAMAALPELAPRTVAPPRIDLCRSVGLVHALRRSLPNIRRERDRRRPLDFRPTRVSAARHNADAGGVTSPPGYVLQSFQRGDSVLRIRQDRTRTIRIER